MSEKQIHNPAELLPPPTTENPAERLAGEAGAINFADMRDRSAELVGRAVDVGKLAYHSIGMAVARIRMERAGDRMERMDHKNALYQDTADEVLHGGTAIRTNPHGYRLRHAETASGERAQSRTIFERMKLSRLEKRQHKQELAELKRTRILDRYSTDGQRNTATDTSSRHARRMRFARKSGIDAGYYGGNYTARERRQQKNLAEVTLSYASENTDQRQTRRALNKTERKLHREARQPMLGTWRTVRQRGATSDIKRQHNRAEKHKRALESMGRTVPEYRP